MNNLSNQVSSSEEAFKNFPERLTIAKRARGIYANSLALSTGLTQSTVSNYETGKNRPTSQNFFKLCEVLNTHPNFLCGISDQIEYRNYSVLIEELLKDMSASDQQYIFRVIRDFKDHFYNQIENSAHLVVPFPGAPPPF